MQIHLKAPKIWLANEAVDFRKGIHTLCSYVAAQFERTIDESIYIFYNQARNKLKLLSWHRNGYVLIYKCMDKKRLSIQRNETGLLEMNEQQLAWLLAGLDWQALSGFEELSYEDYY